MNKRDIVSYVLGGGQKLLGRDVAKLDRAHKGRVMTMRHVWQDEDDGRVAVAVWKAAGSWAQEIANANNHHVELYAKSGHMLLDVEPEGSCSEGGDHDFTPDLEYDATGQTVNCSKCGEAKP